MSDADAAARTVLRRMFEAAISAAQPAEVIAPFLPSPPRGRTIVLGAGKASAAMAQAVERLWPGPLSGLVVTPYGHGVPCEWIEIIEAAHPVPDIAGEAAARRMLALASGLDSDDLALCLISGGGSALLSLPADGLALPGTQRINAALLTCGATIGEINTVRRHLSAIKGGRLARACCPARVVTVMISDVPGDRLYDIASGPTVADPTTCADTLAILRRYAIAVPDAIVSQLENGALETVKDGDICLENARATLIATPQTSLDAAARIAEREGLSAYILGDAVEGEARDVAAVMAAIARQVTSRGQPFKAPCVLLSGGETTVTLRGSGKGGRNVEFLLALAHALDGRADIYALAGDTDGIDGSKPIAGAIVTPTTLARARAEGLNARAMLDDNDAHTFFSRLNDQVVTGPTRTNVNDFRAILILER